MQPQDDADVSQKSLYVPAKIRNLAASVAVDQNAETAMTELRQMYPKTNSLRTAVSKLRAALIEQEHRHQEYDVGMKAHEEALHRAFVEDKGSDETMERVRQFYSFRSCPLQRQLQIQKKIRLGDGNFFRDAADTEFVRTLPLLPTYVEELRLNEDEVREHLQRQEERLTELSSAVVRVENSDELVLAARRTLKNPDAEVVELATALALVTGRRMIEIFQKGQFTEEAAEDGERYTLLFCGQAKCGLQQVTTLDTNEEREYTIPLLATRSSVILAIARLRGRARSLTMTPKALNSKWCRRLNAFVKRHVHRDLGFHDLRTLYALLTFEAAKPHTYGLNGWVNKVLGHRSVGMSVHYTRMQVYGINKIRRKYREATEDLSI